ncbi:MAG: hypothetical protein H0X42_11705 [Solirubrobacterales bacterium]|nr:hypothetical protein [Solirubrobacterales bacterium]
MDDAGRAFPGPAPQTTVTPASANRLPTSSANRAISDLIAPTGPDHRNLKRPHP